MSTSHIFEGKLIKIPGVKSRIKSGIVNPPVASTFGNLLVIDTGSGAGYGGGAGINGEFESGKKSLYRFDTPQEFQSYIKGGLWWDLANPLFRPNGLGVNGIASLFYIRACTTTAAEINITFVGDGDGSGSVSASFANGGTLKIKCKDEGVNANGVLSPLGNLQKGYAFKMFRGTNDTSKYILSFYAGSFVGNDVNNLPYNGVSVENAQPILITNSIEFSNIQELIDWMIQDFTFNQYFDLAESTVSNTGVVDDFDLIEYSDFTLASGGTETYSQAALDTVLEEINDIDVNFVLCDQYGLDAQSSSNFKIVSNAIESMKFKPEVYVAAGGTISQFEFSKQTAAFYNNDSVTVVHGSPLKSSRFGSGFIQKPVIYKAAAILGREAGLAPQVPITFKSINIDGEAHLLNDKQVIQSLDAGLVVTRPVDGSFDIVKGINTLQNNQFLINEDGTTHSKQIKRIARQLNKEIVINAQRLLKQESGVNRNTLSPLDVQKWLESYLTTKIATLAADNLILSFQDIVVTREQDAYRVNYSFVPNGEISFLFFTGLIID